MRGCFGFSLSLLAKLTAFTWVALWWAMRIDKVSLALAVIFKQVFDRATGVSEEWRTSRMIAKTLIFWM